MFFGSSPKRSLDLRSGGLSMVSIKSSFMLAILLIANPFMLLVFQNCSSNSHDRVVASSENTTNAEKIEFEPTFNVGKNLKIK